MGSATKQLYGLYALLGDKYVSCYTKHKQTNKIPDESTALNITYIHIQDDIRTMSAYTFRRSTISPTYIGLTINRPQPWIYSPPCSVGNKLANDYQILNPIVDTQYVPTGNSSRNGLRCRTQRSLETAPGAPAVYHRQCGNLLIQNYVTCTYILKTHSSQHDMNQHRPLASTRPEVISKKLPLLHCSKLLCVYKYSCTLS